MSLPRLVACCAVAFVLIRPAAAQEESRGEAPKAVPAPPIAIRKNLIYGAAGGRDLKLDLYRPEDAVLRPLVVVLHGGGWTIGSKDGGEAPALCARLAVEGYVAASVGYRLAPAHLWPAQLDDARSAVQFLRANAERFGIDPERVGALGASAGGHLAAFLATADDTANPSSVDPARRMSSRVRAAVSICGPMDLRERKDASEFAQRIVVRLLVGKGDYRDKDVVVKVERRLGEASPAAAVDSADGPILLIYGEEDTLVLPAQAEVMAKKLARHGVPHEVFGVKGGGHCEFLFPLASPTPKVPECWTRALDFLRRYVREAPAAATRPAGAGGDAAAESRPTK